MCCWAPGLCHSHQRAQGAGCQELGGIHTQDYELRADDSADRPHQERRLHRRSCSSTETWTHCGVGPDDEDGENKVSNHVPGNRGATHGIDARIEFGGRSCPRNEQDRYRRLFSSIRRDARAG